MAKTYTDLQTMLSRRLGTNTPPIDTAELAKRRGWMWEAVSMVCGDEYMWFMKRYYTTTGIDDKPYYAIPTRFRQPIEVRVDNLIITRTTKEEFDRSHQNPDRIVSMPSVSLLYEYYIYNDNIYFSPLPTAPTAKSITATSSGTEVTATSSDAHGFTAGQFVTIAGANETAYNGSFEIKTVPSTTTFTYTAASTPSATPATGTLTATLQNIEIWYWETATEPTADSDSIVIPDQYAQVPVAYAEGRYWSSAHKRGKAGDAFTEFETSIGLIRKENFRRKFNEG